MVAPTGVPARIEMRIPAKAHITEIIAANIVTDLKVLNILIAERAGKITRAEISREPTKFIATTMIKAITIAISKL